LILDLTRSFVRVTEMSHLTNLPEIPHVQKNYAFYRKIYPAILITVDVIADDGQCTLREAI